jgi:hypothetical protein
LAFRQSSEVHQCQPGLKRLRRQHSLVQQQNHGHVIGSDTIAAFRIVPAAPGRPSDGNVPAKKNDVARNANNERM